MFTRFPCGAIKDQDILNTQTSMGFSNSLYPQIVRGLPSWATGNSAQNLGGGGMSLIIDPSADFTLGGDEIRVGEKNEPHS